MSADELLAAGAHVLLIDAANDGHSGFTIYSRLIKMARSMVDAPAEGCYSFNLSGGSLYDPLGRGWHPNNPNYDPGPPPPPKPPKVKVEQEKQVPQTTKEVPQVSRQPVPPHRARGHHRYRKQGEGSNRRPRWPNEPVSGSSSIQTNGLEWPTGTSGERGRSRYAGLRPIRQPRDGGRGRGNSGGIGPLNKYVRGLFRTLRRL